MKSTAHINGHPIHPMLIPYPFALLSSAFAFDAGATLTGRRSWAQTAEHMTSAGLGAALVAALPGIIDYFGTVPPHSQARRRATKHALCNASALVCFALSARTRGDDGQLRGRGLTLAFIGTGLLFIGGWLGGELIYHERVGVLEDGSSQLPLLP